MKPFDIPTGPPAATPAPVYKVNGRSYTPMDLPERQRQLRAIKSREAEVNSYIAALEGDDKILDALTRSMASFDWWCDHFAFTFDPRDKLQTAKRFILYDYQRTAARRIIKCIREGRNVVIDKSRDMGATWLVTTCLTWLWLFDESFHSLIGSRKEDLVDDFTVDSIFGKIDFVLERLPVWMVNGYQRQKTRTRLKIAHPQGNLMTGESANPSFGRGPRKNVVVLDEYAFWENDRAVWTGVADTAPCIIAISTPHGEGNKFAELRFSEEIEIEIISFHWTEHPLKDLAWYEKARASRTPIEVAQELDIDYKASAGGLAFPTMPRLKHRIVVPRVHGGDKSHENAAFYMSLDWGTRNPTALHVHRVHQVDPQVYRILTLWEFYKPSTLPELARVITECPYFDVIENIYADPSMWIYNQNSPHGVTSLAFLLRDFYKITLTSGRRGDQTALSIVTRLWEDSEDIRYQITEDCPAIIAELEGLRYQVQTDKISQVRNVSEKLVDKNNHGWDGLKYFVNSRFHAPLISRIDTGPVATGWPAMEAGIKEIRQLKIDALTRPARRRRRFFSYR